MKKWLFVGTLEQLQKAPDDLIKAFSLINDPNIKLTIIGDGRERQYLEHISKELGLTNRVEFIGHVKSPQEVRRYLLEHPFFVLPSRGEGLPRSMIEAMACQCITVGSNIGGIQELIDKEFTVNRNRPKELAEKIHAISNASPEWLKNTAINNQNKAYEYLWTKLNERRVIYYSKIKEYFQRINEDSSSG